MRSVWRSWGAILFAALTIGVDHGHAKQMDKDKHTVRMGELLVSAISIEDGPSNRISGPPHRIFGVHVRIQNVGKQFPCTTLKAYLVVKPFYEYPPSMLFEDQPSPNELLPGQTAQGQYTFDIRDGVVAKELLLKAERQPGKPLPGTSGLELP